MESRVSLALAVPEIQAGIFLNEQFSLEDLAQLMLVNHQWAAIIRPFLWYYFEDRLYHPNRRNESLTETDFVKNAGQIRSLVVQSMAMARWLTKVDRNDKNRWLALDLVQYYWNRGREGATDVADVMTILKDCTRLRELSLMCIIDQSHCLFNGLDQSLNGHSVASFGLPQLRVLNLSRVQLADRGLELLPTYCPSLENLALEEMNLIQTQTIATSTPGAKVFIGKSSVGLRDWTRIRKLALKCNEDGYYPRNENLLGLIALERSKKVRDLTVTRPRFDHRGDRIFMNAITQVLGLGHHTAVASLMLVNFRVNDEVDDIGRLLETFDTFPESIVFRKCQFHVVSTKVLSDPNRLCTLKAIDLTETSIFGDDLFLGIVLNSPRLVSLKIDSSYTVKASVLETTSLDWTCMDLERFECHITATERENDDRYFANTNEQARFERDQTTLVVEQGRLWSDLLFKQLARLRKLKNLNLNIELPRHIGLDFKVAPLQMYQALSVAGAVMESIDICAFLYTKNDSTGSIHTILPSVYVDWCRSTWPGVKVVEYEQKVVYWEPSTKEHFA